MRNRNLAKGAHILLGKAGEDRACGELTRRGYAVIARRFRTRVGEIDIVARDGDTLVFVEVKARRSLRCGTPAEAVDADKRRRLVLMATQYLSGLRATLFAPGRHQRYRFDVVSVTYPPGASDPAVEVIQNAFGIND